MKKLVALLMTLLLALGTCAALAGMRKSTRRISPAKR